ncbi:hypothetical protein MTR_5g026420 [Medicago truncatula]|uniref:Uncharacterized protein n=1 Tax=Medicago truncatula TaxID=3880 RepID=G7K5G8_MEDTR|nr:hypothetical protein MTR_5g026420 [Medicago truncatula]
MKLVEFVLIFLSVVRSKPSDMLHSRYDTFPGKGSKITSLSMGRCTNLCPDYITYELGDPKTDVRKALPLLQLAGATLF